MSEISILSDGDLIELHKKVAQLEKRIVESATKLSGILIRLTDVTESELARLEERIGTLESKND